jgi:uncharacterized membrane protein YfcA
MTPKAWLFLALGGFVAYYAWSWLRGAKPADSSGSASGSPATGAVIGMAVFAVFGWVAGGGVQMKEWVFTFASPFSGAGANSSMWISILSISLIGLAVPLIMHKGRTGMPSPMELVIGFVTNFFDTLGIGSFAPTTAAFKAQKIVDDRLIPGTLNVGHTPPTIAQAFIFITIVEVEFKTLALLILAAVMGSWLGAGFVAGWSRQRVQVGMGVTLLLASIMFILRNLDGMREAPLLAGGTAISLSGGLLIIALLGNFFLGALMTLGVGLYAPCLIMIALLGMNPTTAFPIMMGSCAFLMPVASERFVTKGSYALRPALGLTLAGIPAVLIAAIIVGSLPAKVVMWAVPVVVLIASVSMLRAYSQSKAAGAARAA